MELGLQLYSVRTSLQQDALGTLKKIAAIGYKNIEFANHACDKHPGCGFPMAAKELGGILSDLGLRAVSCHAHPLNLDTIGPVLDNQQEMGNSNLVFGMTFFSCEGDVLRLADRMNEIGRITRERGVTLFYHNHFHEFQRFSGKYALDILMDNTDPQLVGMQLDTYWTLRGGQDPIRWIEKLGRRCSMVHQKDLPAGVEPVSAFELLPENPVIDMNVFQGFSKPAYFTEVGIGVMDIRGIVRAAEETGAEYIIVEQDHTGLTELESIQVSYGAITRLLSEQEV